LVAGFMWLWNLIRLEMGNDVMVSMAFCVDILHGHMHISTNLGARRE